MTEEFRDGPAKPAGSVVFFRHNAASRPPDGGGDDLCGKRLGGKTVDDLGFDPLLGKDSRCPKSFMDHRTTGADGNPIPRTKQGGARKLQVRVWSAFQRRQLHRMKPEKDGIPGVPAVFDKFLGRGGIGGNDDRDIR